MHEGSIMPEQGQDMEARQEENITAPQLVDLMRIVYRRIQRLRRRVEQAEIYLNELRQEHWELCPQLHWLGYDQMGRILLDTLRDDVRDRRRARRERRRARSAPPSPASIESFPASSDPE